MMTRALITACAALGFAQMASAQGVTDGWKTDLSGEGVLVVSTMDDVQDLPARTALGEVALRLKTEKVLQNGAEIGLRFEAKAQQDHPARAGFSGRIDPFAATETSAQPEPRGALQA